MELPVERNNAPDEGGQGEQSQVCQHEIVEATPETS